MKWMGLAVTLPWLIASAFAVPLAAQEAGEAAVTRHADLTIDSGSARPPLISTGQFAGRSDYRYAKLSPDGTKLAFVRDYPLRWALFIVSPDTEELVRSIFLPDGFDPISFGWAGDGRLIVHGVGIHADRRYRYRVRRLFLATLENDEARNLIEDPFVASYAEVLGVAKDGSFAMIAHAENPRDYDEGEPAVYRYDLIGEHKTWLAQESVKGISDWTVDDAGIVRLGMGLDGDRLNILYRGEPGGDLQPLGSVDREDRNGAGAALSMPTGSSSAYVLGSTGGARVGLHRYDYPTGKIVETIYQNPDWDVEDVWFRDGEPIAVAYTDDAERIVWLNEDDRALYEDLHAALGGGELRLMVTSRSRDNGRMLIWAGDESDPGVLYLFDRAKRDLKVLAAIRPDLDLELLAHRCAHGFAVDAFGDVDAGDIGHAVRVVAEHG